MVMLDPDLLDQLVSSRTVNLYCIDPLWFESSDDHEIQCAVTRGANVSVTIASAGLRHSRWLQ